MRTLRYTLPATHNIRINAICPLATDTGMLTRAVSTCFRENNLAMNTAEDVANVALGLVAGTHKSKGKEEAEKCNGLSVYVEGGRGWEIEEGLDATRELWMGKEPNERLMAVGKVLAPVSWNAVTSG
jgi:NAD(P)-dependent dehydrogenase (short-subunit alcohol dehydrogenase family)